MLCTHVSREGRDGRCATLDVRSLCDPGKFGLGFKMPRTWLDEANESLYAKRASDPLPPDRPNLYRVLGAIACVPRMMQLVGSAKLEFQGGVRTVTSTQLDTPPIDVTNPAGLFELRFAEEDRSRGFWRQYLAGKRMRSHVSFHCGIGVPMVYILEGPGLLFPFKQTGDLDRFMPYRGPANEAQVAAWRAEMLADYDKARLTLSKLTPDDDEDRCICLIGESLVQEDIEESFSCLWRAIERIAKMDLRKTRSAVQGGNADAGMEYARRLIPGLINSQPKTLEVDDAVAVTVARRAPARQGTTIDELYGLRTAILHDNPTPEQVQQIATLRGELLGLAYEVARSALSEKGLP